MHFMKFFKEFGEFIKKGNVLDLAIGMIIGSAFNKIVSSLVNDIIMPVIGVICKVNVTELKATLVPAVLNEEGEIVKAAVTLNYGNFIQTIIDFLIIALSIFVALKVIIATNKKLTEASEFVKEKAIHHKEEEAKEESEDNKEDK